LVAKEKFAFNTVPAVGAGRFTACCYLRAKIKMPLRSKLSYYNARNYIKFMRL
jgi:hypothetical protein